jgi:hypothetical protein
MKFIIERTSIQVSKNKKPCDEAYWQEDQKAWVADIKNIVKFSKKYGPVIVRGSLTTIEIYDDHRE